jgi:hypothetical protein
LPDFNLFQRVENFIEQRKTFRQAALVALRKREGLPSPVDQDGTPLETRFDDQGNAHYYNQNGEKQEHVLFVGAGKDSKPGSFAVGTRKQDSTTVIDEKGIPRTVPTADVDAQWGRGGEFQILDVAEDGRRIESELLDLHRDAATYERAERVSHGDAGQQAPELHLAGTTDEEIDETLQKFLKRGL